MEANAFCVHLQPNSANSELCAKEICMSRDVCTHTESDCPRVNSSSWCRPWLAVISRNELETDASIVDIQKLFKHISMTPNWIRMLCMDSILVDCIHHSVPKASVSSHEKEEWPKFAMKFGYSEKGLIYSVVVRHSFWNRTYAIHLIVCVQYTAEWLLLI